MTMLRVVLLWAEYHSAFYVEKIGLVMFAAYLVSVIIVLVNILIAMMSNSFNEIQVHAAFCCHLNLTSSKLLPSCVRKSPVFCNGILMTLNDFWKSLKAIGFGSIQ